MLCDHNNERRVRVVIGVLSLRRGGLDGCSLTNAIFVETRRQSCSARKYGR